MTPETKRYRQLRREMDALLGLIMKWEKCVEYVPWKEHATEERTEAVHELLTLLKALDPIVSKLTNKIKWVEDC